MRGVVTMSVCMIDFTKRWPQFTPAQRHILPSVNNDCHCFMLTGLWILYLTLV